MKTNRSNNGSEFNYTDLYNQYGIIHQQSCAVVQKLNNKMLLLSEKTNLS